MPRQRIDTEIGDALAQHRQVRPALFVPKKREAGAGQQKQCTGKHDGVGYECGFDTDIEDGYAAGRHADGIGERPDDRMQFVGEFERTGREKTRQERHLQREIKA